MLERFSLWLRSLPDDTANLLVELTTVCFCMMLFFGVSFLYGAIWPQQKERTPDVQERIALLSGSLNSAAKAISEIESEIKQREALVQRLKDDAETATKLTTMSKEQTEAVAQVLRGEMEKEKERSFWGTNLSNLFYAVLGIVLAELFRMIRSAWKRKRMRA
jgi:F0F1-type ATP synthase membrane subunit b/b'